PEQLYAPYRRFPSESACAFSSYGVFAGEGGDPPPGCRSLTATAYVVDPGGISRNCRASRLHAARKTTATIAHASRKRDGPTHRSAPTYPRGGGPVCPLSDRPTRRSAATYPRGGGPVCPLSDRPTRRSAATWMRASRAMAHPWNVILVEQTIDVGTAPLERGVDL